MSAEISAEGPMKRRNYYRPFSKVQSSRGLFLDGGFTIPKGNTDIVSGAEWPGPSIQRATAAEGFQVQNWPWRACSLRESPTSGILRVTQISLHSSLIRLCFPVAWRSEYNMNSTSHAIAKRNETHSRAVTTTVKKERRISGKKGGCFFESISSHL